jgi:threonine synthase
MHLRCSNQDCAATLDLHDRALSCPVCADLLEVIVDSVTQTPTELKRMWLARRTSYAPLDASGVWRFREFLPSCYSEFVTMAEGNNPIVRGQRTAQWCGVRNLNFKHLGWNPTACFKDLGMTVGMTEAVYVGAKSVGCASTGNTAASLAAYAARAGLTAKVFLPAGQVSQNKLAQALDFGAEVVQVDGSFDLALERMLRSPGGDLYFLNSINPFRLEG